jgi:hypothetical protein
MPCASLFAGGDLKDSSDWVQTSTPNPSVYAVCSGAVNLPVLVDRENACKCMIRMGLNTAICYRLRKPLCT